MTVAFISGCVPADDTKETSVHITSDEEHVQNNPLRSAYFGDFHVHTNQSFDAFIMGAREDADAAETQAKALGMANANCLFVNHPIQDASSIELARKADSVVDQVIQSLSEKT
jgi:hypothetical protein